jgi:NTE family protein
MPFTLGMSSGFFSFFAHCGMLQALEEQGLLPARLAGSSAGALVAALWAAGLDTPRIAGRLMSLTRADFWDPRPGLGLLKGRRFREILDAELPVAEFSACRRPLAVSTWDLRSNGVRVFDSGLLAPAVHASCAVPLLFHPVWIGGRPYLDGGVVDRHGLAGVPAGERLLYHHIASRSPWRRAVSPAMKLPDRPDTVSLVIEGVTRLGPFKLARGRAAFEQARDTARRALGTPVAGGVVRIGV